MTVTRTPVAGTTHVRVKCKACRTVAVLNPDRVNVDDEVRRHETTCTARKAVR